MRVFAAVICVHALVCTAARIQTPWLPTVVVSDYDTSYNDPNGRCRRVMVLERLSRKVAGLEFDRAFYDKCARQHADNLLKQARETRLLREKEHPDMRDPKIEPLERMYRVALYAIQPHTTENVDIWVCRWKRWWYAKNPRFPYDIRSDEDRFFAYVVERQMGFIRGTSDISKFEEAFNKDFISAGGFRPYKVDKSRPNRLLN